MIIAAIRAMYMYMYVYVCIHCWKLAWLMHKLYALWGLAWNAGFDRGTVPRRLGSRKSIQLDSLLSSHSLLAQ